MLKRTDLTAGAMICFGLGSFMMAMTFGVSVGGSDGGSGGAVSQEAFSASSFLRRRGSPGAAAAAARISVICWSVAATVAGFVMVVRSLTVSTTFAVAVSATEAVDLVALSFLAFSVYAQNRAGRRSARPGLRA